MDKKPLNSYKELQNDAEYLKFMPLFFRSFH